MKVSMFPKSLAHGPMSISKHESKNYSMTFSARLNNKGEIIESKINRSIINKIMRTNYNEIDKIIEDSKEVIESIYDVNKFNNKEIEDIKEIYKWATIRKEFRREAGAQLMVLPKPKITVIENEIKVSLELETKSTVLVSEMMILAGQIAAEYSFKNDIPIPYRSQVQIPDAILDNINNNNNNSNKSDENVINEYVRAWSLIKESEFAKPTIEPQRHYGMGLNYYTRTTSPIRRYTDIITHFQLKAHLRGIDLPFTKPKLNEIIPTIHHTENEIKVLQKNSIRFWVLRHLEYLGGAKIYNGIILSNRKIQLPFQETQTIIAEVMIIDIGFKVDVKLPNDMAPGTSVQVQLDSVDPFKCRFNFVQPSSDLFSIDFINKHP